MIHQNVITDFCQMQYMPEIDPSACIHPVATVIGSVSVGKRVMVSPFASVRGDEGKNCVIEPGCIVMRVSVADGHYVPAVTVLKDQDAADNLPVITDVPFKDLNSGVVHVNTSLADGYNKINLPQMITL